MTVSFGNSELSQSAPELATRLEELLGSRKLSRPEKDLLLSQST